MSKPSKETKEGAAGIQEMEELDAILSEREVGADRIVFDPAIVREMEALGCQ